VVDQERAPSHQARVEREDHPDAGIHIDYEDCWARQKW
jgi:hypothetical protein